MKRRETVIQEGVFLGFLAGAALLLRESSGMDEKALWYLLTVVLINACLLRVQIWNEDLTSAFSIVVNSLLVAWIVEATGGGTSLYWPLFLLPLYTTGLSHPSMTIFVGAAHAAMLAALHLDASLVEFSVKAGFLLLSAWAISKAVRREQSALGDAAQKRVLLERVATRLAIKRIESTRERRSLREALAQDADRMTVILATAQLMKNSLHHDDAIRLDADRILNAANSAACSIRSLLVRELARPKNIEEKVRQ